MQHHQKIRYSRHLILNDIGEEGQKRLLGGRALVIGAGGLGSPALLYLAASGVGNIGVIDCDKVELSNLQRQIIHETADVNRPKAESAADAIHDLNPDVKVDKYTEKLHRGNVESIIGKYDIVLDGSDNFETRFTVNDACVKLGKPLVTAAILRFEGQVTVFMNGHRVKADKAEAMEEMGIAGQLEIGKTGNDIRKSGETAGNKGPCYRCLYPEMPPAGTMPDCSTNGIFAPVAGIAGTLQACEAVKILAGMESALHGYLMIFDGKNMNFRKVKLNKDEKCRVCG